MRARGAGRRGDAEGTAWSLRPAPARLRGGGIAFGTGADHKASHCRVACRAASLIAAWASRRIAAVTCPRAAPNTAFAPLSHRLRSGLLRPNLTGRRWA